MPGSRPLFGPAGTYHRRLPYFTTRPPGFRTRPYGAFPAAHQHSHLALAAVYRALTQPPFSCLPLSPALRRRPSANMMRARSLKRFSWNTETQALYEQHLAQELEFTNLDTLFGAALRTGDPVISNRVTGSEGGTKQGVKVGELQLLGQMLLIQSLGLSVPGKSLQRSRPHHVCRGSSSERW